MLHLHKRAITINEHPASSAWCIVRAQTSITAIRVYRENIKEDYGARRARNELERQQVWQETAGREIKMQINLGQEESSFRTIY
jgi:hypothetical protein